MALALAIVVIGTCGAVVWLIGARRGRDRKAMREGTYARRFVYVGEDGSIRELTADEQAFLTREYHPTDSGRPYVKPSYRARAPDGKMQGFLERSDVPLRLRFAVRRRR